ncbi:MAG: outer membrane protein assembly factor BamA [Kiritimatiellae bacterium]|nr:outer membrane protein assembly factor BamA [Kiritimatiellia bacterium]
MQPVYRFARFVRRLARGAAPAAAALCLAIASALPAAAQRGGDPSSVVRDIRVEAIGRVPVSAEQVLANVSARVGQDLDRNALSADLRQLQKSKAFSYAEVRVEDAAALQGGIVLVYRVSGRPKIRRLSIRGADYMGNKKIREWLEIEAGARADNALLGERSQAVREKYRKDFFPNAKLEWKFTPVPEQPEFADLEITVAEGKRAIVRKILFEGNEHVSRRDLLEVMTQKQSSWLSFINNDGIYEPGTVLADREAIRGAFMDRGYLAARVGVPTYEYVSAKKIDITYEVEEGPLYTLRAWRTRGVTLFPEDEVSRGVPAVPGKTASLAEIRSGAQTIRDYYGSRGYIKTGVEPRIALDTNAATAAVTYDVKEGSLAYIRNIEIRGNSKTKDKVIRREIGVAPGDVWNEPRVRSSENRIRNLNYFSYVGSYSESTSETNQFNLVFDVEEQNTGSFTFGVGFSSIDSIIGYAELRQGNFDLFGWPHLTGGGQKLNLRLQIGSKRSDVEAFWIEPWFLDKRLSLGIDLFRRDARYYSDDYDQTTTGGSVTLGQPLFSFNRINYIYGLTHYDIHDVSTNASPRIQEEEGKRLKSYGTLELVRDTRDKTFLSTRGFRGSAAATLAGGPFGADTDNYAFRLRASQYIPLWFGHVLNFRGMAGMVKEYGDSDRVPIFDREFLGGPRSVRAFKYRKLGPKDEDHEAVGGRSAATATAEYTLPIVKMVRFALFYDVGVVWQDVFEKDEENPLVGDGEVCDGYGIGIRFDLPQFPIQLDYAWPINTDDYLGTSGRFSFNIGYTY